MVMRTLYKVLGRSRKFYALNARSSTHQTQLSSPIAPPLFAADVLFDDENPFLENAPDIAATVAVGILPNKTNLGKI